jgi:predicted short-subunit dehydrogenase-like oxidoreductase (DUF2520 family)
MAAMTERADPQHEADHGHDHQHADDGKPRIGFIGAGRVGTALGVAFSRAGWEVSGVASRDAERRDRFHSLVPTARAFADATNVLDEADLIFLTVPDDAIAGLAASLHLYSGQALVHTSGALPATVLAPAMAAGTSKASFHPLVAFADLEHALDALHGATVALDGDESLLPVLADIAESVGARAVRLPEGGKAAYHAAAMMAAGGLVGLLDGIVAVARLAGLDEKTALAVYTPLARQALANAERLGVDAALTGPFLRGDVGTVRGHLDVLRASAPEALNLYVAVARRELDIARRRAELGEDIAGQLAALLDEAQQPR